MAPQIVPLLRSVVTANMDGLNIQWCPDISPGPVQPDNETIRGVGHKTVLLPLRCIWLK